MLKSGKQFEIGALLSYISIALNVIAGLLYTPWMIEQIGDGDYGLYTLANSLISLFLLDFGLGSAISKYISEYRARGKQEKIDNFLGAVYKLYIVIDAVILIVLFIVYFFLDNIYVKLTLDELEKFKVVYIIAAGFAVINFPFVTLNGIISSYERFIELKLADVLYRILLVGVTVFALLMGQGLYALVTIHAIVGLLMIGYKLAVIKRKIPLRINWKYKNRALYREVFGFSFWVMIYILAQRLIFNITPSILGVVANSVAIAVFGVVTTIEGYSYTVTTAINGMFLPRVSRIYANANAQEKAAELMLKVGRIQYTINGLIVTGFAILGKEFIALWMGAAYTDAYYGILLVIIPGLFYNAMEIANTAMVVEGKVKTQAIVAVLTGVVNVILSFVLSYHFGVVGACLSIFSAYMFRDVAYIVIYHRQMHFDMVLFAKKCYLRMSIPMVITISIGIIMNYYINIAGWIQMIAKGTAVCVVYTVCLWLFCVDKLERQWIINKFKKVES